MEILCAVFAQNRQLGWIIKSRIWKIVASEKRKFYIYDSILCAKFPQNRQLGRITKSCIWKIVAFEMQKLYTYDSILCAIFLQIRWLCRPFKSCICEVLHMSSRSCSHMKEFYVRFLSKIVDCVDQLYLPLEIVASEELEQYSFNWFHSLRLTRILKIFVYYNMSQKYYPSKASAETQS